MEVTKINFDYSSLSVVGNFLSAVRTLVESTDIKDVFGNSVSADNHVMNSLEETLSKAIDSVLEKLRGSFGISSNNPIEVTIKYTDTPRMKAMEKYLNEFFAFMSSLKDKYIAAYPNLKNEITLCVNFTPLSIMKALSEMTLLVGNQEIKVDADILAQLAPQQD